MKTVVLLLLLNTPDGAQHIVSQSPAMEHAHCEALAQAVWAMPETANPVVAQSPEGPLQRYDAACVLESEI